MAEHTGVAVRRVNTGFIQSIPALLVAPPNAATDGRLLRRGGSSLAFAQFSAGQLRPHVTARRFFRATAPLVESPRHIAHALGLQRIAAKTGATRYASVNGAQGHAPTTGDAGYRVHTKFHTQMEVDLLHDEEEPLPTREGARSMYIRGFSSAAKAESTSEKKECSGGAVNIAPVKDTLDAIHPDCAELVARAVADDCFTGASGSQLHLRLPGSAKHASVGLLGLGKPQTAAASRESRSLFKLGHNLYSLIDSSKSADALFDLRDLGDVAPRQLQCLLEGFFVEGSIDCRFKGPTHKKKLTSCARLMLRYRGDHMSPEEAARVVAAAKAVADGIARARDLVNAPANVATPIALAKEAEEIAKEFGMKLTVFDETEIQNRKMGAYYGVAQGSVNPPRFIHLTYGPTGDGDAGGAAPRKVALVGKGITFDSGGYNLKVGNMIELMKFDMGGSAAVLGAATAIGRLRPSGVEVHFIVPAAENMVSDKAYRPGDILTASNGMTIEVHNTDAEGRLTLADALVYAEALGVDAIVDIATLTGACMVALGEDCSGLWGNDAQLIARMEAASLDAGDMLWNMPLIEEYRKKLDSKVADISNSSPNRYGGSISAALFLKEFVKSTPWCHLDIAGTAWKDGCATGSGVRTLTELVLKTAKEGAAARNA
eukprot:GHVU01201662.1.p1 GENE.GHVU01201662.1~~GHVU01201662.1.p1  ORF type:complete len:701 (-),score=105.01 GHVU01201662.1:530-2503(-)